MPKKVSLSVKCPSCGEFLTDDTHLINNRKAIGLNIKTTDGKEGKIWLSSIYGDYNYTCEVPIPEGEIVDFMCPKCSTVIPTSLIKRLLSPHREKTMWRSKHTHLNCNRLRQLYNQLQLQ